ncbi:hypothetical protein [Streptomyces sp. NPDC059538]|uniref:hypothetical protein n=1 Tax=Streptomyces sp. NPDC059538 TaxID=3346860 RepID=UPI00369312E5
MIVKEFTTVAAQQELMRHIGGGGGELGQQAGGGAGVEPVNHRFRACRAGHAVGHRLQARV